LVRHFLVQSAKQLGVEAKRMSDAALQFLCSLELPGNVRQLENLCNWITVMAPGQTVEIKDLPLELSQEQAGGGAAAPSSAAPVESYSAQQHHGTVTWRRRKAAPAPTRRMRGCRCWSRRPRAC
jgi:two-component system nitrogen regulation response regulator GlnG